MTIGTMGGITDLWHSERGMVALALIVASTVMVALGNITPVQWLDFGQWIFLTYAAAKTVTGAVAAARGTAPADAKPAVTGQQPVSGTINVPSVNEVTKPA